MFDAHVHLQDPRIRHLRATLLSAARDRGVRGLCCCATSLGDVAEVAALPHAEHGVRIARAFGIHPWHAADLATGWAGRLEALLVQHPAACVGEIGLDGLRGDVPRVQQRAVLETQLHLAVKLQRPVILHGARAWGELSDALRPFLPKLPACVWHGFSGSAELLRANLCHNVWFSVSGTVCNPRATRLRSVAGCIPLPHLLVETDAPDLFPVGGAPAAGGGEPLNQPANLPLVLETLAQLRAVAWHDLCHATDENARRALCPG